MSFRLYREANTEDVYAASSLEQAKEELVKLVGAEEAKEYDDWHEVPDSKVITVDCDGEKVTKTAAEWANEDPVPGVRFGANY